MSLTNRYACHIMSKSLNGNQPQYCYDTHKSELPHKIIFLPQYNKTILWRISKSSGDHGAYQCFSWHKKKLKLYSLSVLRYELREPCRVYQIAECIIRFYWIRLDWIGLDWISHATTPRLFGCIMKYFMEMKLTRKFSVNKHKLLLNNYYCVRTVPWRTLSNDWIL